jgi:transcriptional regulator with XRE-family HTH domain
VGLVWRDELDEKKAVFGRVTVDPKRLKSVLSNQRARLGLTHRAVAEIAGVAPATVYNLEQGNYRIQLDKFLAVLAALELLPEHVLEIDSKHIEPPASRLETDVREILENYSVEDALVRLGELLRDMKK